ncbi:glycine--tRNA ligase [Candidatus Parcubacteria bacterium]|nr:glycine--tRNA ligase [Candidatus Parcubacteria bacterium]
MEKVVSLCKRRGFVFQGSEIYGGMAGSFDYGPLGVTLKNNIKNLWWKMFVENRTDVYGVDAALLMNSKVWEASGHVSGFSDPLVECKKCKRRFRADHLEDKKKCPECEGELGAERQFNMMFKTHVGATEDDTSVSYLRPETAQGIFVNFKNVLDSLHPKLPFGIAQIGKAFRNEIAPRDFVFRTREFEQMEIEYFFHKKDWEEQFEYWRKQMHEWLKLIGLAGGNVSELEVAPADRAHYSKRTIDFEYEFPFGKKELYGLAYRTDFDLSKHSSESDADLSYFEEETKTRFTPHVIEPSFGVDRTFLAVLCEAYTEDELGGESRTYLKFPLNIAPVKIAVFPLLKNKPELVEKARTIFAELKATFGAVVFDDNGNIGKRYRRQDEIGTPYCVTIDFDTLEDNTVTIRNRNTGEQERVRVSEIAKKII